MRPAWTIAAVLVVAAVGGGCLQILGYEDPVHYTPDGGGGATSTATASSTTTSTSTSSGAPPQCSTPASCPGGGPCVTTQCNGGVCELADSSAGTACNEGSDGKVCDGAGHCVACTMNAECGGVCTAAGACNDPVSVSGGYLGTWAILQDGSVWGWGDNSKGEIGDGTMTQRLVPTQVTALPLPALAVVGAAPGGYQTCAILNDNSLWCWGANDTGQLGLGNTTGTPTPLKVPLPNVVQVSLGDSYTCAVDSSNALWCWGDNDGGELGTGNFTQQTSPAKIVTGATLVATGYTNTCMVKTDANVYCWGSGVDGQNGDGTTIATDTPPSTGIVDGVVELTAAQNAFCARNSGGGVSCWGQNDSGEIGVGSAAMQVLAPQFLSLNGPMQIACGAFHCGALTSTGLMMWGDNTYGQLGNGTLTSQSSPELITSLANVTAIQNAFGTRHSCAITADHHLYCWGDNSNGQLGNGSMTGGPSPQAVVWP
jgi:alpha-tubulin suppressor-like RCC1 family protein